MKTLASGTGRRILFMRTKHHAKKLAKKLTEQGIPAVDLHGNLSQPQRDRNLAAFADGSAKVLVATDVAARGVHVDNIELVIHVDPPMEHKAYLHRSGRTARAGSEGDVVTICLPAQKQDLQDPAPQGRDHRSRPQRVTAHLARGHVARRRGRAVREAGAARRSQPQGGGRSQGAQRAAQARGPRRPGRRRPRPGPRTRPRSVGCRAGDAASRPLGSTRPRPRPTPRSRAAARAAARRPRARSAGHPLARAPRSSPMRVGSLVSPRSNRRAQG